MHVPRGARTVPAFQCAETLAHGLEHTFEGAAALVVWAGAKSEGAHHAERIVKGAGWISVYGEGTEGFGLVHWD